MLSCDNKTQRMLIQLFTRKLIFIFLHDQYLSEKLNWLNGDIEMPFDINIVIFSLSLLILRYFYFT